MVVQAQTIPTPTQTDQILPPDNGAPGKADPGDKIQYKVNIQNTGSPAATGVQLNAVPDIRTTLDPLSFRTSPLAFADAYACTGNVGINVPAASGLKANDYDDNIGLATITAGTFTTTGGGTITIMSSGSFTYMPLPGYTGVDTYVYTLEDGNEATGVALISDMATVTITVSNLIWFIDNASVAATSDGRVTSPFKTLNDFNAASTPVGDVTYIDNGTGAAYTGGIVLQDNERLFGEGHTGAANLSGVLPFSLAPFSNPLPAINGTRPVITNAAGDGVALAMNNSLRGFNVGDCSDFGMDNISTNSIGNLVVSEVNITNTIGGGFEAANGSGASMNAVFGSISSTGGTYGVDLTNCAGTFTINSGTITNPTTAGVLIFGGSVTFSTSGTIATNAGLAVDIDDHDSNNATFSGNITSTSTTNIGIRVQNCAGGTKTFSGASKSLNTGANAAVRLNSNASATIDFTGGGLVINTTTGAGFDATTGGTVTVTGAGNTITKSGNGNALNIANVNAGAGAITFVSINVTGGTGTAVSITSSTGTKNLGDVDVARAGGGTGILASNAGTLNTTDGTINSGNQTAISISNTALGVVLTSVSADGVSGPVGRGIDLVTTTGSFTVNGTGTTNGSGGTIQNITQRGASFETATNITLKNMVFNDANTLDAATCTYASATGCNGALYLRNVTTVLLNNVDVDDTEEQGLNGENINGLTVTNCLFTNCGTAQEEGCMKIRNLSGTCSFTGSVFSFGWEELVEIYNQAGSAALTLTIDNCDFTDTQFSPNGERGVWVEFSNSVTSTVNIDNCDFLRVRTQGTRLNANGTATVNYNVTDSNFDRQAGIGSGVTVVAEVDANVNTNINRNMMNMINDNAVTVEIRGTSNVDARVNNNTIVGPGINSGIIGEGIFFNAQDQAFGRAEIKDNNLSAIGGPNQRGIIAISRLDATLHAIIDNNNIGIGGTLPSRPIYAIEIRSGSGEVFAENSRTCAYVHHNDIIIPAGQDLGAEFRVRKANAASIIELQPLAGVNTSSTDIWNNNLNTTTQPPPTISESLIAGTISYTGVCQPPIHATAYTDPTNNLPGSRLLKLKDSSAWSAIPDTQATDTSSLPK